MYKTSALKGQKLNKWKLLPFQGVWRLQEYKPARRPGGFAIRRKKGSTY